MRTVHKFRVPEERPAWVVKVPGLVKVVLFGRQQGELHVWAEVETDDVRESRLEVVGTGHHLANGHVHHASCVDGTYVWHLYGRPAP